MDGAADDAVHVPIMRSRERVRLRGPQQPWHGTSARHSVDVKAPPHSVSASRGAREGARESGLRRRPRLRALLRRVRLRHVLLAAVSALLFLVATTHLVELAMNAPPERQTWWLRKLQARFTSGVLWGEQQPAHPHLLPGLRVRPAAAGAGGNGGRFSAGELLARYDGVDFVYTFMNASELGHAFRGMLLLHCGSAVLQREAAAVAGAVGEDSPPLCRNSALFLATTGRDIRDRVARAIAAAPAHPNRETDELRHSLRSIEKHIQWHRGRVVVVSPGHHPLWMDNARTFLAGSCGGPAVAALRERGTHVRVTTVHQDAVMPYGMKLTVNSHIIEQHLWRVLNMTPVHVYWNDDYFVNRDVAITDLFNERGGTIVRTESTVIDHAERAEPGDNSWQDGVSNTNLFTIAEIDGRDEMAAAHGDGAGGDGGGHLPRGLLTLWSRYLSRPLANYSTPDALPALATVCDSDMWHLTAYTAEPEPLPRNVSEVAEGRLPTAWAIGRVRGRYLAAHAPFVYCTGMHRYLSFRYQREFSQRALRNRFRQGSDLFMPFLYNAFIMARPWAASPQFLPYLWFMAAQDERKKAANGMLASSTPVVDIVLDNVDGCGPALQLSGFERSQALFTAFTDDTAENELLMQRINVTDPLFFNINAGFTSPEASQQLLNFLHSKFPDAVYLERGYPAVSAEDAALPGLYAALMRLPVVAVTSFAEGVCPLLRSLQLALPDHAGVVVPVVARDGRGGDVDATLAELRAELRHRVRSAMPVVGCAYSERVVRPGAATAAANAGAGAAGWGGGALAGVVAAALGELGAGDAAGGGGVTLPAVCGGAGGGVRIVGIVVDGRSDARGGVRDARWLRRAVTMPGQTLALEDFEVVPVGGDGGGSVLVLSRASAAARAVHWIDGAAESDLLATYPIPHAAYEDLKAPLQWVD